MARVRGVATAIVVVPVLWFFLDSEMLAPRAPTAASASLLAFAALFGLGAWAFQAGGRGERSPMYAGLAAGAGVYALLRLVL